MCIGGGGGGGSTKVKGILSGSPSDQHSGCGLTGAGASVLHLSVCWCVKPQPPRVVSAGGKVGGMGQPETMA